MKRADWCAALAGSWWAPLSSPFFKPLVPGMFLGITHDNKCPVQISVLKEGLYGKRNPQEQPSSIGEVILQTGIITGKLGLNRLHRQLAAKGFIQAS
ncbi:glycogen debranching enzyme isoform X2 [Arapaima gigas]